MSQNNGCLVCGNSIDLRWKFCLFCGARIDPTITLETRSIDYLINEIPQWYNEAIIDQSQQERLQGRYREKRESLIKALVPPPKPVNTASTFVVRTDKDQIKAANTNATAITSAPTPTSSSAPIAASTTSDNTNINNNNIPVNAVTPPSILTPATGNAYQQRSQNTNGSSAANNSVPERSFGEIIADNIKTIFAMSGALFVGGIALYYRNEIYHGLTQPVVQATILALLTLGMLISGILLVRRTEQSIAGRTLTLVGALLVPLNPWFLVRSQLIPDTGNAWVLGFACAILYASIAYFLRDRLFVYISSAATIIAAWATVFKFSNGAPSIYAITLMGCALLALFIERAFKPAAENVIFSREEFGAPFFHVGQTCVALCLLFYTPLIKFLPAEFIATKQYFDPSSYSNFVTIWLALGGLIAYGYSAVIRRKSYFSYLAIICFLWTQGALLINLHASLETALLSYAITTLIMGVAGTQIKADAIFIKPINISAIILGFCYCIWAIEILITVRAYQEPFDLRTILTAIVVATFFTYQLIWQKERVHFYCGLLLWITGGILLMLRINFSAQSILMLLPLASYGLLIVNHKATENTWKFLRNDLNIAAFVISITLLLSQLFAPIYLSNRYASVFYLEIGGIIVYLSYLVEIAAIRYIAAFVSAALFTISYSCFLASLKTNFESYYEIPALAIWVIALYAVNYIDWLHKEIKTSYKIFSTIMAMLVLSIATLESFNIFWRDENAKGMALICAVIIVGIKEAWQLHAEGRWGHSLLLGISGLSLTTTLLNFAKVNNEDTAICYFMLVSLGYILLAQYWRTKKLSNHFYYPIEILANIVIAIGCIITLLAHDYSYNLQYTSFFSIKDILALSIATGCYLVLGFNLGKEMPSKLYTYLPFVTLLFVIGALANYFGANDWALIAAILMPVLIIYPLIEKLLSNTNFAGAPFIISQGAFPIVVMIGIIATLDRYNPPLNGAIFFAEIAGYYLISAYLQQQNGFLYPAFAGVALMIWKLLYFAGVPVECHMIFIPLVGIGLLNIAQRDLKEFQWSAKTLTQIGHIYLFGSAIITIFESFAKMSLGNDKLIGLVITAIANAAMFLLTSSTLKDQQFRKIYRYSAVLMGTFSYISFGIWAGYDLLKQTEFYSLPIGGALLIAGYLFTRSKEDQEQQLATVSLFSGSLLWTAPLLLHSLQYRFVLQQSGTQYDIGTIFIAILLIIGGIVLQFKSPTIIGGAGFLIELSVIVFSFVEWEQKWLSISMIVLAIVVFVSTWLFYVFSKRNQLHKLNNRGRHILEEFGKWK